MPLGARWGGEIKVTGEGENRRDGVVMGCEDRIGQGLRDGHGKGTRWGWVAAFAIPAITTSPPFLPKMGA